MRLSPKKKTILVFYFIIDCTSRRCINLCIEFELRFYEKSKFIKKQIMNQLCFGLLFIAWYLWKCPISLIPLNFWYECIQYGFQLMVKNSDIGSARISHNEELKFATFFFFTEYQKIHFVLFELYHLPLLCGQLLSKKSTISLRKKVQYHRVGDLKRLFYFYFNLCIEIEIWSVFYFILWNIIKDYRS